MVIGEGQTTDRIKTARPTSSTSTINNHHSTIINPMEKTQSGGLRTNGRSCAHGSLRAPRTDSPTWATCICGTSRLRPPSWPRGATSRSIHLEHLTGRGHISKPEYQQISPRCLYAYSGNHNRLMIGPPSSGESEYKNSSASNDPTNKI